MLLYYFVLARDISAILTGKILIKMAITPTWSGGAHWWCQKGLGFKLYYRTTVPGCQEMFAGPSLFL